MAATEELTVHGGCVVVVTCGKDGRAGTVVNITVSKGTRNGTPDLVYSDVRYYP